MFRNWNNGGTFCFVCSGTEAHFALDLKHILLWNLCSFTSEIKAHIFLRYISAFALENLLWSPNCSTPIRKWPQGNGVGNSLCEFSTDNSKLKIFLFSHLDRHIKGTVSRDGYFFKGLNILISTFCVFADCFQGLSKAFHYPIQLLSFYLLLWSYLLILKMPL